MSLYCKFTRSCTNTPTGAERRTHAQTHRHMLIEGDFNAQVEENDEQDAIDSNASEDTRLACKTAEDSGSGTGHSNTC